MSRIFWAAQRLLDRQHERIASGETGTPVIADLNRDNWLDLVFPNTQNEGARIFWGPRMDFAKPITGSAASGVSNVRWPI